MFIAPGGKKYTRFLTNLHSTYVFDWYLEIGCRTGRTFGPVKGKTIAVLTEQAKSAKDSADNCTAATAVLNQLAKDRAK